MKSRSATLSAVWLRVVAFGLGGVCLVGAMVRGLGFVEPTRGPGPCSSAFCIDYHCCCACSGTLVGIDGYMQGAGEHGGDAGFLGRVAGWVMAVYTPLGLGWWLRFLGCTGGYLWFLMVVIGATRMPIQRQRV